MGLEAAPSAVLASHVASRQGELSAEMHWQRAGVAGGLAAEVGWQEVWGTRVWQEA